MLRRRFSWDAHPPELYAKKCVDGGATSLIVTEPSMDLDPIRIVQVFFGDAAEEAARLVAMFVSTVFPSGSDGDQRWDGGFGL